MLRDAAKEKDTPLTPSAANKILLLAALAIVLIWGPCYLLAGIAKMLS